MAYKVLITGAGSVMGQSIYKALSIMPLKVPLEIHFANSEENAAGRFFNNPVCPVVARPIFPLARDPKYVDFVEEYCIKQQIDIVYAGTQHELEQITILHQRIPITATIPTSIAQICLDKLKTPNLLRDNNLRFLPTFSAEEFLSTPQERRPIILKPVTSSASRNIFSAEDQTEVLNILEANKFRKTDFIVQDRLIGSEYTCGCYIDRYSGVIQTICFERSLTLDGATGYGKIINDKSITSYVLEVGRAFQKAGMAFGHVNVQLIKDKMGPCLFEVNGRLSSTEAPKAHFGFNSTAAYFTNIVLKQSFDFNNVAREGQFLRFYDEVYF